MNLSTIVNGLLARVGLRLVRCPPRTRLAFAPSSEERAEISRIIREFTSHQDPAQADISNPAKWEAYLDDGRLSFFAECLQMVSDRGLALDSRQVADFGSGTGYLLRLVHRNAPNAKLTGIDSFSQANELAKMVCPTATFFEDLDATHETYDLIFCTEVLEHLIYPREQVQRLMHRVAPGGHLVLTVPNGRSDTHPAMGAREDGTAYWGHCHFWSPESWPLFLEDAVADRGRFATGTLSTGDNWAIVTRNA